MKVYKIGKNKALEELKNELTENIIEEIYRGDYGYIRSIVEEGIEGLNNLSNKALEQKYWETFSYNLEDEYERGIEIVDTIDNDGTDSVCESCGNPCEYDSDLCLCSKCLKNSGQE